MRLLTRYGTVVRVDVASGTLIHAPLWPKRDCNTDLDIDLRSERTEQPRILPGQPPTVVLPAPTERCVQLLKGNLYLSAKFMRGDVSFTADFPGSLEVFMALSDGDIAMLRSIARHGWEIVETGVRVDPGESWIEEGIILLFGQHRIVLERNMPWLDFSGQMLTFVNIDGTQLHARRRVEAPERKEMLMTRSSPIPAEVGDREAFLNAKEATLTISGGTEYGHLPLTANVSDQAWMYERFVGPGGPTQGPYETKTQVVRQQHKYLLQMEGMEGIVFDEAGVSNWARYLLNCSVVARGSLMREGNYIFLDRKAMEGARELSGCYAVFCTGGLSNYYNFTIESLLSLFILRPFLPAGARLLIPGRVTKLRGKPGCVDHIAALHAWGFGGMERVEVAEPVCRAEEVLWLDHELSINIPAKALMAARTHVLSLSGLPGAARRIYIRRYESRDVVNASEVEAFLAKHGFETADVESMPPQAQIDLFRDAEFVVGTHGASLSNILYCASGTRVLELSPRLQYRSNFSDLSNKLGLIHGVLPCPADDDESHVGDRLLVDLAALGRLFVQLQNFI